MSKLSMSLLVSLLIVLGLVSCSPTGESASANSECPPEINTALSEIGPVCAGTGRNEVCYGNTRVDVTRRDGESTSGFDQPGDLLSLNLIERLLLGMNTQSGEWGVAIMRLQTNIENALPGQNITFVLFGDVSLSPDEQSTNAFYFESGIGDAPCREAPESGLMIQTPEGIGSVQLMVNQVDIALGSTALLQAQPGADMFVNVIEGRAEVTAQNVTQTVFAGNRTRLTLDDKGNAASPPEPPEPYDPQPLTRVPYTTLERHIGVTTNLLVSDFSEDSEDWRIFADGTDIEHFSGEDAEGRDGFICSNDQSTGVYWYFLSPESWAGDRSEVYGGTLSFTIREQPTNGSDVQDDIILASENDELVLVYRLAQLPRSDWTSYAVPLQASAGWTNRSTGEAATENEMRTVLSQLQDVYIRGEYITGSDTACLDDVRLNRVLGTE